MNDIIRIVVIHVHNVKHHIIVHDDQDIHVVIENIHHQNERVVVQVIVQQ